MTERGVTVVVVVVVILFELAKPTDQDLLLRQPINYNIVMKAIRMNKPVYVQAERSRTGEKGDRS